MAPSTSPPYIMVDRHRFGDASHGMVQASALIEAMRALGFHNLPAAAYKGPALSQLLYGSVLARDSVDLDIVVRERDALRAKAVLAEAGFTMPRPMTSAEEAHYLRADDQPFDLFSESRGVHVELHWQVSPRFFWPGFDLDAAWQRARAVEIGGVSVNTFCAEDYMLILCVHGAKHCWSHRKWIRDIAQLTRVRPGLDWDFIWREATATHVTRMLSLGVVVAQGLLSADFPRATLERASKDRRACSLARAVIRHQNSRQRAYDTPLQRHLFRLRALQRSRDRARYTHHFAWLAAERALASSADNRPASPALLLKGLYRCLRPFKGVFARNPDKV